MPDSAVSYIQVQPTSNLFTPATRAFGNIAIIGDTTGTTSTNPFETFIRPDEALQKFPGALGDAIATAFKQTPGPTVVYGVHAAGPDFTDALTTVSKLDVQLVVLAHTALTDTTAAAGNPSGTPATAPGAVVQLAQHVNTVSQHGGDGKERMGVAMFPPGVPKIVLLTNDLKSDRMVYIAHKSSKQDVAAAVAGTIAGYEPHISLLLKPIIIENDGGLFTPSEIVTINGSELFGSPSTVFNGVNWLTSPSLIPGGGVYMGEGYTGDATNGRKYIDIVRIIDDISFRLKARLFRSIGNVRISRSGLRSLIAQMEAVLDPLLRNEVINSYQVIMPLLAILDKDPNTLTPSESTQKTDAESNRIVQLTVAVEYAAAIHRLAINLKFN